MTAEENREIPSAVSEEDYEPTARDLVESFCGRRFDFIPPDVSHALTLTMQAGHLTQEAKELLAPWVYRPGVGGRVVNPNQFRQAIIDTLQVGVPWWSPTPNETNDAEDIADAVLYTLRDRGLL